MKVSFAVNAAELAKTVNRVRYAISKDSRKTFNCVLVEITPLQLQFVATDNTRLAYARLPITIDATLALQAAMPRFTLAPRVVDQLLRDCAKAKMIRCEHELEQDAEYTTILRTLAWRGAGRVRSYSVSANFPEWQRVIPLPCDSWVHVYREKLIETLSEVCNPEYNRVSLTFTNPPIFKVNNTSLRIGGNATIGGSGGFDVKLDGELLRESLQVMDCTLVRLETKTPMSDERPVVIRPLGDDSYFTVIARAR